ncbi:MAG: metallophosphoesterase family protein [Hyphomicrobiaceae bacterium]
MAQTCSFDETDHEVPALLPRGAGHQFVIYGDACSGIPGAPHEQSFADVNNVVRRLSPPPEFIVFTGDEIEGLTPDRTQLTAQWRHWLDVEMAWLDRGALPMWHATGNHTTYDVMSEEVFSKILAMPHNGPAGQEGLSYWVRRGDLLIIFVHTLWSGLGGEGFVETDWLEEVLASNRDAQHKLVVGHHPVFSINGFSGKYQRDIEPVSGSVFWRILVKHGVRAYLCSHILAFDVQVHRGVLQICTAGAGTIQRMPDGVEYLHCVQMALDDGGLRYQVVDFRGKVRERLDWPYEGWQATNQLELKRGCMPAPVDFSEGQTCIEFRFAGVAATAGASCAQTLLCASRPGEMPPLWIGLRGDRQQLTAIVHHATGRSPHYWLGPCLHAGAEFDLRLQLNWEMGPGGLLYRISDAAEWTSMSAASPWGMERLKPCSAWYVGRSYRADNDLLFAGTSLAASVAW